MSASASSVPVRRRDVVRCCLSAGLCLVWLAVSIADEPPDFRVPVIQPASGMIGRLAAGHLLHSADELELPGGSCVLLGDFPQGDFTLELDCQVRGNHSSNLVLYPRCQPRSSGWGVEGPALSIPLTHLSARTRRNSNHSPDSERMWQTIRLVVEGNSASVSADGCTLSRIALNGPAQGWVAVGARECGASLAVRRAELTEKGFTSLFDGTSLTGWEGAGSPAERCWKADQGCLVCTGAEGPWLRSQRTWANFELRLAYRVLPGGNSGVYTRVPEDGNHHGAGSGIEVQILDDASPRYRDLKPNQFSASLYAIDPAELGTALPAGQWNTLGIRCVDRHYQVTQNGRLVVDRTEQQLPELLQRLTSGYLGLQNHSEQVWFRHLRIRELP